MISTELFLTSKLPQRSDKQIEMMMKGGNKRLREFFEEYKIPKEAPVDFKYKTKAAAYFRDTVKHFFERVLNFCIR